MAEGKWITELTASTSITDAARRVLSVRLSVVRDYLPLAVRQAEDDPEYVHQLRVGTRRAGAALEIFSLCIPHKEYQAARRHLKRIRRAAGQARDWDVFLLGLNEEPPPNERRRAAWDFLSGYALGQRTAVQPELENASPNFPFGFERLLAETVAAVHRPRGEPEVRTLLDLAQPMLARLLDQFHQAASGDLTDYEHLHQVRIIGKQLRYAMELFVDCFAPRFRAELYPAVEHLQEMLGLANDSHVANQRLTLLRERLQAMLPSFWRRVRPGIEALLHFHQQRLVQQREAFVQWWQRWQQSGGEAAFASLVKPAQPPTEAGQKPELQNGASGHAIPDEEVKDKPS